MCRQYSRVVLQSVYVAAECAEFAENRAVNKVSLISLAGPSAGSVGEVEDRYQVQVQLKEQSVLL